MTRNRVEDLGRLLERLHEIKEMSPFYSLSPDFVEWYLPLSVINSDSDEDNVFYERHCSLRCNLYQILDKLLECIEIAEGKDYLNRGDDAPN